MSSVQILSMVVLMLMHYRTPFEAILLAQQSQQCNRCLVPPLSILSRLKKALDDIAYEDRITNLKQELHSPENVRGTLLINPDNTIIWGKVAFFRN